MILIDMLESPEKYIPYGMYCYDAGRNDKCPFWESKKGEFPHQEDGYCHFMNVSDWELNEEYEGRGTIVYAKDNDEIVGKTIAELTADDEDTFCPISGKKEHFPTSLLWDQCKECGINNEDPEDAVFIQYDSLTGLSKEVLGKDLKR